MRRMVPVRAISQVAALALLIATPGLLTAGVATADPEPNPTSLAALIADVAEANQRLDELGAQIQLQQESVNKALVDVQTARDNAALAQRQIDESAKAVEAANAAIADAQQRFDEFAAATYVAGPSASYLTARTPEDVIATASASKTVSVSSHQVMANLQRARTEQVNKESMARSAKEKADQAAREAQSSQDAAVEALKSAQQTFSEQQAQVDALAAQREEAKARLAAARPAPAAAPAGPAQTGAAASPSAPAPAGAPGPEADWDRSPQAAAGVVPYGDISQWDTTLPMVPSAFMSGDPIAIVNTVLQISATSAQVTADLGRKFLEKIGILKPADTGITNGAIPRVYGRQASEYVIRRGMSQMGVPYSWGGGNAAGPSRGIDSGANTVGFDCSGLVLYAFAGVGIKLPHYSGSQYNMGRKIPSSQMRRGDVIFYGPGGSQHVTIYLGDGQMLEAPYTGSHVKISPVRTSGMTPHVVRYIEY
ncbi:NlpC/P60 family peptidoglycan endopeptidase RipA [[Mycobacterium] wendilense]|uniref:NlpC/P60 family peptidoglycan endopeptidase RipA n=2 Tax=[Mycobacterium] wendilense TaxID=3064284 RepID=A0ABM9MEH1_9MYCO|nr:NlpC/P60 family peptidoglycan endopeptidase RipA [Mycolicibacterium sp. MU0050]CAJ1583243.1 NlpC/P60 family peptidoglycan endopeptidase RipA [Mycolicibacterium sp. MU0050]